MFKKINSKGKLCNAMSILLNNTRSEITIRKTGLWCVPLILNINEVY